MTKEENRTMSELVREALRRYRWERQWDGINAYGTAKAASLNLTEDEVVSLVKAFRREKRPASQQSRS